METLGSKLAEIEAAEARRVAELEAAELASVEAAAREEKEEARSEFDTWKQEAILAITAGNQPLALSVPHWMEGRADIIISNPKHRDHDLFLELQRWAQSEGMEILVDYDPTSAAYPRLRLISSRSVVAAPGKGPSDNNKPSRSRERTQAESRPARFR